MEQLDEENSEADWIAAIAPKASSVGGEEFVTALNFVVNAPAHQLCLTRWRTICSSSLCLSSGSRR